MNFSACVVISFACHKLAVQCGVGDTIRYFTMKVITYNGSPLNNSSGKEEGYFPSFAKMFGRKKKATRPQEGQKKNDLSNLVFCISFLFLLAYFNRQIVDMNTYVTKELQLQTSTLLLPSHKAYILHSVRQLQLTVFKIKMQIFNSHFRFFIVPSCVSRVKNKNSLGFKICFQNICLFGWNVFYKL